MATELVLSVLHRSDARGYVAGMAVTDQRIVAIGGDRAAVTASSDGVRFEPRAAPRELGLRDILAVGDSLWVCGEDGQLAVSRDHGARWELLETGTHGCLRGLALGGDGAIWVVGDAGYAARVLGEAPRRIDVGTDARLSSVQAVRDEVVMLGGDGKLLRWRDGKLAQVACGATRGLTSLAITGKGTWVVVGEGGFVARSPDGTWYSRVELGLDIDLEAIGALPDQALAIVGDRGHVLVSGDDARTWRAIAHELGHAHLWSIERFGGGVLIGGDGGLIAKLAPPEDATWRERSTMPPDPGLAVVPDAAGEIDPDAELERTPRSEWGELAWRWIDDGAAHRALLARLDHEQAAQIAALDALSDASEADLATAIPRVAGELSPELVAVLVGSLVRGDALDGALDRPHVANGGGAGDADDDDAPGWDAIDRALAPLYGGVEPLHFGTVVPYSLGGPDPIRGISVFPRDEPRPHWHFVTYGFTELFGKESDDPETSGYGFELTLRLARAADDAQPPAWALNFLQNLARYVFNTGNAFAAGHKMGLNGPIALERDTAITAVCFADDPELGDISSVHGKARFVQIVGITDDEYRLIQEWSTGGLLDLLRQHLPLLLTDLGRSSVLDDPAVAAEVRERLDREGSSEDLTFAGELKLSTEAGQLVIELGALYAVTLPRAMRGRIRHGRNYTLQGREAALGIEPSDTLGYRLEDTNLVLEITPELAREIETALGDCRAGTYRFATWPRLTIVVTPSIIRGQDGSATDVRGVSDPEEAKRIVDDENARLAAAAGEQDDDADDEEDGDVDDDDDDDADDDADDDDDAVAEDEGDDDDDDDSADDDDDEPPDSARVAAALAMTTRGLRLVPDDTDLQFTHAMLLIDAERAGDLEKSSELLALLPAFAPDVRINVAVRMGKLAHPRFGDAVELVLAEPVPDRILGESTASAGAATIASFGDVTEELLVELGQAILDSSPQHVPALVPRLPANATLFAELAERAIAADQREGALLFYERMAELAIPDEGEARTGYLRALNNACIHAHAAGAFATAVRIADRAQPVAHENPYIYHAAACAYAAIGDHARALEQVKLALEHDYDHAARIETDGDLGPLLEWPEFKELFREWRARGEGN